MSCVGQNDVDLQHGKVAELAVPSFESGARILHAAVIGRHQLLHSRLSHADQQQLALLSRLGVSGRPAALAGHLI